MNNEILKIDNLKKHFKTNYGIVKAVDGINFSINEGDTFGLIGESGSGKSTVAYTVIGLYEATSGEICYKNRESIKMNTFKRPQRLRKDIQMVFQDPSTSLNPSRTIKQILELPLLVNNIEKNHQDRNNKILELLEKVQLPLEYLDKYPTQLGGGERQLVNIARALATDPSLIILDEPTSALDVSIQAKVISILVELQQRNNFSYLFITHDLSLMRNVASRIGIMYLGKIFEIASTDMFFKKPLHPYTKMLLSSIPVISKKEEDLKPKQIVSSGEIPSPVNIPPGCRFYSRCPNRLTICNKKEPVFLEIERGHYVSCHLYIK